MDFLSPAKLLVILVVALAVLGPDKLPTLAKQVGSLWRDFSRFRQKLEADVRGSFPDLPSTESITNAVRSPLSFLDTLADAPPMVDGTGPGEPGDSGGSPGTPGTSSNADAAEFTESHTHWPTETVIGSEGPGTHVPAAQTPVLVDGASGVVHEVRPGLPDPASN